MISRRSDQLCQAGAKVRMLRVRFEPRGWSVRCSVRLATYCMMLVLWIGKVCFKFDGFREYVPGDVSSLLERITVVSIE
jgi:hypothetical protein